MPIRKKHVSLGVAAVSLVVCLGLAGALPGLGRSRGASAQQTQPEGPRYASYLQMVGVKPMDLDAANRGARRDGDAWVLGDVDLERARELAAHPKELDVLAHADHKWIPTQTWKLRHGGATPFAEAKEACAIRHLTTITSACHSSVAVVLERDGDNEGHVAYVKPRYTPSTDDECRAYTDCLARNAWLGRESPLPSDDPDDLYAFIGGDIRLPFEGNQAAYKASFVDDIAYCERNLSVLRRMDPADDPFLEQNITLMQDLLEHSQWLAGL